MDPPTVKGTRTSMAPTTFQHPPTVCLTGGANSPVNETWDNPALHHILLCPSTSAPHRASSEAASHRSAAFGSSGVSPFVSPRSVTGAERSRAVRKERERRAANPCRASEETRLVGHSPQARVGTRSGGWEHVSKRANELHSHGKTQISCHLLYFRVVARLHSPLSVE